MGALDNELLPQQYAAGSEIEPSAALLSEVTAIWERVLGRSALHPNANFFDLGGDSLLATQLFVAIEEAFGNNLPPDLIFETPTIENMARILASEIELAAPAALITMKVGSGEPPLFVIPGAPGSALQLGPVISKISEPISVYAIKPKGSDGVEVPLTSIEAMAEHCLEHILAVRSRGPYFLTGYSLGGVVAFEIARRLTGAGHSVPLLLLLDSYPSERVWPIACHAGVLAHEFLQAIAGLKGHGFRAAVSYVKDRYRGLVAYASRMGIGNRNSQELNRVPQGLRRVYAATEIAGDQYRPSRYDGKIVFFQPSKIGPEPRRPASVWRRFAAEVESHRLLGTHVSMLDEYAAATAAELSGCLKRARMEYTERSERQSSLPSQGVPPGGSFTWPIGAEARR